MTYSATTAGSEAAFKSIARNTASYRSAKFANLETAVDSLDFTDEQRDEQ